MGYKLDSHGDPVMNEVLFQINKINSFSLFLAKNYAKFIPKSKIIAVSGSIGKTTTVACSKEILGVKFKNVVTTSGEGGNPYANLVSALLTLRPKTEKAVLELPLEDFEEIHFYKKLIRPEILVLTKISDLAVYEQYVNSLEGIQLILNWEDGNCRKLAQKIDTNPIFYGFDASNCHIWAGNMRIDNFQTIFELNYGVERVEVKSKLLGFQNVLSMLASASLGMSLGIPLISIKKALEKVEPLPHRMQAVLGHHNSIIIDDSYNSDPDSLEEALEALNRITARRRIVVLGEVNTKSHSELSHRQIARKIYSDKIDLVLTGTGDAKFIADELDKLGFLEDRMEADLQIPAIVSRLLKILSKGDLVLIKGSSSQRLSEVVKKVSKPNSSEKFSKSV